MKNLLFIVFSFIALSLFGSAQSLDVFNIDASGFPVIKANFYAFDKDGKQISTLAPSDFKITEDGVARTVKTISCPPVAPPRALSSVLTMDISGSMGSRSGNISNLELAKTAARAWIAGLPPGRSECAITAFDDNNYFIQDFTNNKQKLFDALQKLGPNGGTDYNKGFLLPQAGGLEVIKQAKYKRVLIFLSDGIPNFPPDENAIVALANQLQVTVFCVTLGLRMPEVLKNIANKTGGECYENVTTQSQAEDTYIKILKAALGEEPCELQWLSQPECTTERNVDFSIPAYNASAKTTYNAPNNSIVTLEVEPSSVISMGSVVPGTFKDTSIIVSVHNSMIQITDVTVSNPTLTIIDYGGSPPPFILQDGENRVLKIRFAPTDSSRIFGKIIIENDKCSPVYAYIVGGFRGKKSASQQLKLTHPNGGEVFVVGSDTTITWGGVPLRNTVKLDYSADNGKNWESIKEKTMGFQHEWHVPNTVSDQCLVKVSSYESDNNDWAKSIAGKGNFAVYSKISTMTVDEFGDMYFCGFLQTSGIDFGHGTTLDINGGKDLFVAKYNSDGIILWAKSIISGSSIVNRNMITDIKADKLGNIYITGHFEQTLDFGNGNTLSRYTTLTESSDSFLAKLDGNGKTIWAKVLGGHYGATIQSLSIGKDGNIYMGGSSHSTVLYSDNIPVITNPGVQQSDGFIIKYDPEGNALWGRPISGDKNDYAMAITTDTLNNSYICGSFSSKKLTIDNGVSLVHSLEDPYSTTESKNSFIIKYNAQGGMIWGKKAGTSNYDHAYDIVTNNSGDIYLSGQFYDTLITLGNGIELTFKDRKPAQGKNYLANYDNNGNILWAKISPVAQSIASDLDGNLVVGGQFQGLAEFGNGAILNGYPYNPSGFVAKYTPEGDVLWAKKINSLDSIGNFNVTAVATDERSNIYFGGEYFGSLINFDNGITLSSTKEGFFTGKYAKASIDQTDTSDAVFSIVKPIATSQNIDMGRVLVTSSKDSLIQSFIINTGSYPIRIDAINITGTNASEFQLVSGIPPFTIPVGEKKSVEFRFRPTAVGGRSADLSVITQADTLYQAIIGEGVKPVIQIAASLIDFGVIEVGSLKDTTVTAVLKNIGDVPLSITNTQMLGPDKEQFEIISGGGSFSLAAGAQQTMQLRFSPKYIGRTSGQIGFDYAGMAGGRPAVVQLFGQGIGGMVYVVDDSAYVGKTYDMKLMLGKIKPSSIAQTSATAFKAKLAFSNTILTPTKKALSGSTVFKRSTEVDTLEITRQWNSQSSELARIPMVATLGDRIQTDVELLEFDWLDDAGKSIGYDTEVRSGVFKTLGICPEGGDRLYDIGGTAQMMMVAPNPVNGVSEITFETVERGTTRIMITDVLGRQQVLKSGDFEKGDHSFQFDTENLTSGIYILTMQTPTQIFTQQIIINK
ncbi:MAG: choice-of-anchor D domain-containing protein [Bacteroidota bacterium]